MLNEPCLLTVRKNIVRPPKHDVDQLSHFPTAHLADALNGHGSLDYLIKPIYEHMRVCGPAVTAFCGPMDNLAAMASLDVIKRGDVLVIATDRDKSSAKIGDLWIELAKKKGLAGVVCDGLVRDKEGIKRLGVPVFAVGISSNSSFRNGPGTINTIVSCGGVAISPGDIVTGDIDGVVVIRREVSPTILAKVKKVSQIEQDTQLKINRGEDIKLWSKSDLQGEILWYDDER